MGKQKKTSRIANLTGKILISSPLIDSNSYFYKSVIYIVQHINHGAIGVMINYPISQEEHIFYVKSTTAPEEKALNLDAIDTYFGGPIEIEKALILHSNDYGKDRSKIALSSNLQILRDIASGIGPKRSMLTLGYCGWVQGQLEQEIKDNVWVVSSADEQLVFSTDNQDKWHVALDSLSINPYNFTAISGNC